MAFNVRRGDPIPAGAFSGLQLVVGHPTSTLSIYTDKRVVYDVCVRREPSWLTPRIESMPSAERREEVRAVAFGQIDTLQGHVLVHLLRRTVQVPSTPTVEGSFLMDHVWWVTAEVVAEMCTASTPS